MNKESITVCELTAEVLFRACDARQFDFEATDELPYTAQIIGQERAVEAIEFGLDIDSPGFNIFVMGPAGTGRRSILYWLIAEQANRAETPGDWVYVNHFADPSSPRAITLPAGKGRKFRADMERFNNVLLERLQQAFETDEYADAREELEQQLRAIQQQELAAVEEACQARGFALVRSPSGLYLTAVMDGELLTPEGFSQLPAEERSRLTQDRDELEDLLNAAMRRWREQERKIDAAIEDLDRNVADFTVTPLLQGLQETYADHPKITAYLDDVRKDVVENVAHFREESDEENEREVSGSLLEIPLQQRYRVNLFVDNGDVKGAPMILEETPTYDKLFGRIEYDVRYGATVTDHTLIRSGALHRANGGYLILEAEALLETPYVWVGLKRALYSGLIRLESPDGQMLVRTITPVPEPIPLKVKVILKGSPETYYALHAYDEDFAKIFKVQADFNSEMNRTQQTEKAYANFIRSLGEEESLLPFTPEAVARIVEYGARLTEHQERLSTHFGKIADLVREASYWARRAEQQSVRRADVLTALERWERRSNLSEELSRRDILEDFILISTQGRAVGQVNGLSILTLGNYDYGMPNRITARAYVGRGNVVAIHREINLSGPIHGKGILTLVGYFGGQYGQHRALSMEASLNFEQVYSDLDGDSASSAELYALISACSEIELRQDLAVTGAVDQYGNVLPIGGVNEKIEGFFEICRARGLTGTQGALIPWANVKELMLKESVVEAVREGQFHIYPISRVDEGLALLTGRDAGKRNGDGHFPEDSVHGMVEVRLRAFSDAEEEEDEDSPPDAD